jgi:hypothetical protein
VGWYYSLSPSNKFKFERTNLTYGTTKEFEILVPAITHNYFYDDDDGGTGLDPQTSYKYRVAAYHPEFPGYTPWSDPATGTTFDTPFEPTFEASLSVDSEEWQGRCLVQQVTGLAKGGRQLRITVRASSVSSSFVDRLFISKPDPTRGPYASASDLIEVHPKFEVRANRALTLPAIRYTVDEHQPLLIAVDFSTSPPAAPSGIRYTDVRRLPVFDVLFRRVGLSLWRGLPNWLGFWRRGFGPQGRAYWTVGAEAALKDRSPNYIQEDRIYFIEKIDVR